MDNSPPTTAPDWSLVRAFLAVADTGSLSGAAQQLGSSQPTLGRQINALENALDTVLFARHARGLRLTETGEQLLPMARKMAEAMADMTLTAAGKTAVPLAQQVEGFIANRLQAALYREAMHLVELGIATPEQVDLAVTAGLGPRWALAGPFEVMDLGGLDVWTSVTDGILPTLCDASAAPAMLRDRAARGDLGAKTGEGFLPRDEDAPARFAARLAALLEARAAIDGD